MQHAKTLSWIAAGVVLATLLGCATDLPWNEDRYAPSERIGERDGDWSAWDETSPQRMRSSFESYVRNRSLDFMDIWDIGGSVGLWARIETQYGLGFYGFGITDCERYRFGQRSTSLLDKTTLWSTLPFPASLILYPGRHFGDRAWWEVASLGGIAYEDEYAIWPAPYSNGIPREIKKTRVAFLLHDAKRKRLVLGPESFAIGAEAHLLLGARVRVLPAQLLDFLVGIVGGDLFDDDIPPFTGADEWRGTLDG